MGAVIGMTMAEFSGATGLTPSDAYDVDGGRIFVVLGRTVTLAIPGSYGVGEYDDLSHPSGGAADRPQRQRLELAHWRGAMVRPVSG